MDRMKREYKSFNEEIWSQMRLSNPFSFKIKIKRLFCWCLWGICTWTGLSSGYCCINSPSTCVGNKCSWWHIFLFDFFKITKFIGTWTWKRSFRRWWNSWSGNSQIMTTTKIYKNIRESSIDELTEIIVDKVLLLVFRRVDNQLDQVTKIIKIEIQKKIKVIRWDTWRPGW